MKNIERLLTSSFGLGWLPKAPGTWGSLPSILIFALACHYAGTPLSILISMAAIIIAGSLVCVKFAPAVIKQTGKNDPREVVADETAGQAVTFLAAIFFNFDTFDNAQIFTTALLGFLLFRFFDILKPWPVCKMEKYPQGWGILLDDLLAGVFAAIWLLVFYEFGVIEYLSGVLFGWGNGSLGIIQALILGIVQGATEFLPVSSSGHLVLFENIFKFDSETPEMLLFDLCLHVGTVVSIFIVFRKSIRDFVKNIFGSKKYGKNAIDIYKKSPSVHIFVLAIIVTGITGVIGIILEKTLKSAFGDLKLVAACWLITGTLLLITDYHKKNRMGLRKFGIRAAIIIALAQSVAILPGISRSGATICAGILVGLRRRWAVEFSFLIAILAILGAAAIELHNNFSTISSGSLPKASILIGTIAAAITGVFALKLLIKTVRSTNLKYFAYYCYVLACIVLIFLF
jgi:undecaprenyl-diphosphatase